MKFPGFGFFVMLGDLNVCVRAVSQLSAQVYAKQIVTNFIPMNSIYYGHLVAGHARRR